MKSFFTEFRIGNWLHGEEGFFIINPSILVSMLTNRITQSFEPILITPHILIKTGFIKTGTFHSSSLDIEGEISSLDEFSYHTNIFQVTIESNEPHADSLYTVKHIFHLHQLQNLLFCLTGNEIFVELEDKGIFRK